MKFEFEEIISAMNTKETYSQSLVPVVEIEKHNEYTEIEGYLKLNIEGNTTGDNIAKIQHHFPLHITIPNNRINSINELEVKVNNFSFYYIEDKRLSVWAEITIEGIREQDITV